MEIGIIGGGTMGAGIAQVAAQAGHKVVLIDLNQDVLEKAKADHLKIFQRLLEKGKITEIEKDEAIKNLNYETEYSKLSSSGLVIEAIIEDLKIKHDVFRQIEEVVEQNCIIASNTSSLSIASLGSALKISRRVMGIHFFNPAPLMPLVEIIPSVQTDSSLVPFVKDLMLKWGKTPVIVKDTPGFIVNRVARPFYGEALRIYEEGIADFETIDWAMTEIGGFKMGPFTLMDYIGNDVNYAVTESVFASFYYDPRFKPSFTQRRHAEAGFLGRKSGRGYYDYAEGVIQKLPNKDQKLGQMIFLRIFSMLVNEAYDAKFMQIASEEDIDLAMKKGVNYPKGLFEWSKELGEELILNELERLFNLYGEDRYRPNVLLKHKVGVV